MDQGNLGSGLGSVTYRLGETFLFLSLSLSIYIMGVDITTSTQALDQARGPNTLKPPSTLPHSKW